MRRIAAHYVYWHQLYRMCYVELDENDLFVGVFPLEREIAGTEFYDGTLIPLTAGRDLTFSDFINQLNQWKREADAVTPGTSIFLYRLLGITLPAAELCTDNSRCNGYIERL